MSPKIPLGTMLKYLGAFIVGALRAVPDAIRRALGRS